MGDLGEKVRAIERIDAEVLAPILASAGRPAVLVVPDHATPLRTRTHATGPVPFAIGASLPGAGGGGAMAYGESQAADDRARRRERRRAHAAVPRGDGVKYPTAAFAPRGAGGTCREAVAAAAMSSSHEQPERQPARERPADEPVVTTTSAERYVMSGGRASRLAVKEGDLFLYTNELGQVPGTENSVLGLYYRDTRYLSRYVLSHRRAPAGAAQRERRAGLRGDHRAHQPGGAHRGRARAAAGQRARAPHALRLGPGVRAAPRAQLPPARGGPGPRPRLRRGLRRPLRGARQPAAAARIASRAAGERRYAHALVPGAGRRHAPDRRALPRPAGVAQAGPGAVPAAPLAGRASRHPLRHPGGGAGGAGRGRRRVQRAHRRAPPRARALGVGRHRHLHRQRAGEPGAPPGPGRPATALHGDRRRARAALGAAVVRRAVRPRDDVRGARDPAARPALGAVGGLVPRPPPGLCRTAPSARSSRARSCTSCGAASWPPSAPCRTRRTTAPSTRRRCGCCWSPSSRCGPATSKGSSSAPPRSTPRSGGSTVRETPTATGSWSTSAAPGWGCATRGGATRSTRCCTRTVRPPRGPSPWPRRKATSTTPSGASLPSSGSWETWSAPSGCRRTPRASSAPSTSGSGWRTRASTPWRSTGRSAR